VVEAVKKRVRKTKTVRRREIAEAALRIMSKHGYYGASVERIARAVGISNSALYQHFHNREDVLLAASDVLGERAHDWITATTGSNALERLDRIAGSHMSWAERSLETFVRPMFAIVGVSERARLEPSTPRGVLASYDLVLPIVEEGQREGSIRTDVEAGDLAWAVLMFAWAEDMALLSKVEPVIEGGASRRNFARLLSAYAAPQADPGAGEQSDSALQDQPAGEEASSGAVVGSASVAS
jgi:AcrR family transcriptional regulator